MQTSVLQGDVHLSSIASLSSRRLTAAVTLGLALMYLPAMALAQDTSQSTGTTTQAQTPAKPDAKADAKKKEDEQKNAKNLDGVVVTGIRASLETAQSLKQNASQIVDSVTATDINALPDRSVTETLQRISGVTVDHFLADDDPDHPSAEGSGVLIRGLPYVNSLLNGATSFSANNGRSLSFEDVPAELMAGVDVYKNPSAELIEGGIAGTVDLRTRMPFDAPGQQIGFSTGINEGDLSEKSKPSASFLYSNRWKTDDFGEFGALVDLSYSELASRSDGIQTNPYILEPANNIGACPCEPTPGGNNVAVPGDINWQQMDMQRRRTGLYGALQWRPNDNWEIYTRVFRSDYNLQWNEHWVQANEGNYFNEVPAPGTAFSFNDQGIYQDGIMGSNAWKGSPPAGPNGSTEYYTDNRMQTQFTRTTDWSNGFKYNINDQMLLSGEVQFVKSTSNTEDFSVYNQFYMPPANVNLSGSVPSLTLTNPGFLANSANYYMAAAMDHLEYDWAMARTARVDLEYNFADSNWLQYVKVGVRATNYDTNSDNTNSSYNWGPISQPWLGAYKGPASLDWANTIPSWMEQQFTFSNFYGGAKVPTTLWFPSTALVSNYYKAISALQSIEMAGGWCPQITTNGSCTPGAAMSSNSMDEKTQAAYAVLYFGNDSALGIPFDGNIGLRFVHTSVEANGSITYPTSGAITGNTSSISPAELALFNGTSVPTDGKGSYNDVLPSLNLRFKLRDDLQLRLAASQAITRPTISQLNSYMVLGTSWSAAAAGQEASFAGFTGSTGGNPDLKPMKANQYDAALEWYFAPTGILYTTLFKKDIRNYINTETTIETIDGQPVAVTGPQNSGNGTIKGAEFGYSQFFDFLPGALKGLGIQANYTYLNSSKIAGTTSCDPNHANGSCASTDVVTNPPLPMQGLSPNSYNVTGMFEHGPWSARLAWSWRSRYLITTEDTGDTYLPMWNASSGQLDASVFYHINKNLQIGLQMNNLTNTTTRVLMGPTTYINGTVDPNLYTRAIFQTDRRYELVFRGTF
jgi:TonB-dependent receptor